MSHISIEGLRQACLDWRSRIRLNSEDTPQAHAEIRAVSWIGGLLDQERLTFNPHLNVLIGGRGAGKSTLIESIRFAFSLSPRTKEAKANHDKIVGSVIGRGSIVNVAFWSPYPTPQIYVIERIDAGQPRVFDQQGRLIPDLHPSDFASGLEVYGQHEVSELTRDGVQLAALLRRFIPAPAPDEDTRVDVLQGLQRSREAILADESEADRLRERLASLPGMREQLKRFGEAGLAEHFTEKDLYDLEAREFEAVEEALEAGSVEAHELAPSGFVEAHDGEEAPEASEMPAFRNTELLTQLPPIVKSVEAARGRARAYLRGRLEAARDQYKGIRTSWDELYADMMRKMEETIKKLEAEGLDAKKYVSLKEKVDDLQRLEKQLSDILSGLFEKYQKRMELISDWDRIKAADLRKLEKAARKVSSKLSGKVRVRINPKLSIEKVERILRDHTTGNISQPLEILGDLGSLDLSHFAARVREGKDALVREYGFTEAGAQKIAAAERTLALLIEEAEIEPQAIVELNVGSKENPIWKDLENLSTGQKATAVLLLILLGSEAPLVIDQPEDDLDNRFIADVIVETMRDEKQNRQLIFSSHNANIPVLADAELIVGLTTEVEDGVERTIIPAEYRGSIDTRTVSELVKEILEGGKDAFETRRRRYGF